MTDTPFEADNDELTVPRKSGDTHSVEVVETVTAEWDALTSRFADVCLEQTASYMLGRWAESRLCGLILRNAISGEPEALALAVVAVLPLFGAGLAYLKFGPLWRRKNAPAEPAVLFAALEAAKTELAHARGLLVRVMPPPDPEFAEVWASAIRQTDFAQSASMAESDRYLVNLTLSDDEQLASLGSDWRKNLRKAGRNGLEIREEPPVESVPIFLKLYREMVARKGFVDHHHMKQLAEFVARAHQHGSVRVFLAWHSGRPVAGSIITGTGDCLFAAYGAAGSEALPLKAGFALRWEVFRRLRGSGRWLDLGGDEGDPGLKHFKTGFVGTRGRIITIPGEYDYVTRGLSSAATRGFGWAQKVSRASHRLRRSGR